MPAPVPARRRGRRGAHGYGGLPLLLPLVATVNVSSITNTAASVAGSINPQGLSGSWWFAYGTTPALGQTTTPNAVGATSVPQTVSAALSGLTTGATYWVALVGQTAGGTVASAPLSFLAQTPALVTNASDPTVSPATATVGVPHYAFPFAFDPILGVSVVEQGSYEDLISQVQAVAACQIGQCPELPTFGIPDPTFQQAPPSASALTAAIQQWVPGADETAVVQTLDSSQANWGIALRTQVTGTGR